MIVGVPKEVKVHEYRVGLVPVSVAELARRGHRVLVEHNAGAGIGFGDDAYAQAGARVVPAPDEVFAEAELLVKVKEPQPAEIARLRPGQVLFTYFHLAPDPAQTRALLASGATCIAYETVTDERGGLPLLAPMSEIAGRMSAHVAAHLLEKEQGGCGLLLGGVAGVLPAKVAILGAGVSGANAARIAAGMGADVTVLDVSRARLTELDAQYGGRLRTEFSTAGNIEREVAAAQVVIGAVLLPGAAAPKLVSRALVRRMMPGSVLVDIAIDQGGCSETSRPTTHAQPTYIDEGVVHYCVTNMPGAVARTASLSLNNATLPFTLTLADVGLRRALQANVHLRAGLNVFRGHVTQAAVAKALGLELVPAEQALEA
jgi:alanine dehydrogenase